MNKLQIKAEILATISSLLTTSMPNPDMLINLKAIEDKKAVLDILIRELSGANEHKSLLICWLLTELIEKDKLNDELWDVIKSPDYNDHIKMICFNMLKDLGNKIDYDVISGYFEKFDELINKETKELLESAIMNPEAQIDFMDFLNALSDEDKILLIKSLEDDYANDALANIVIPVFAHYMTSPVGEVALEILGKTKSQLAFHALDYIIKYAPDSLKPKINKSISELKLSGVRVDNTADFYKNILKESKPYKSYISFPDGHGNMAVIFSRKRTDETLQFVAAVFNPSYGILDAFGFNSMTIHDFYRIVDRFYDNQEKYEIEAGVVKYLLKQAVNNSYKNEDFVPYEYVCWESILLDITPVEPVFELDKKELSQKDIDDLCLNDYIQNWFFDEYTSDTFKEFINRLSKEYKDNNFTVDLDRFIADNYDKIYTEEELNNQLFKFNISAYLRLTKNDAILATVFHSLGTNYAFLTNIIRKSIYEYYVGKRYLLANQRKTAGIFEQKLQSDASSFELMQLDMIISSIETKWVCNE